MSGSFSFTTPPFTVVAAVAIDASTVRVLLTAVPNSVVPANFSVPGTTVVAAVPDPADASAVILSLIPPLQPNNYTVTCSGLTAGSPPVPMTAPFNAAFAVVNGPAITIAPQLATPQVNPNATTSLRSHIAPSLRGDVWTQLIATLGEEEQVAWDQAADVYDQLFLISAQGKYLDQRASEEGGYLRPQLVGFDDDTFRNLVIQLATRKLTLNAFLRVLEIYYGIDAVRAHVRTLAAETFVIPDGSEQVFNIDGKGPYTVTFRANDFANPTAVSAIEAAVALNRQFQVVGALALALPFVDTQSGLTYLTVYTASRGLRGSIESVSGPLVFPSGKQTIQNQARAAYVRVTSAEVEVVLPATSIVVTRDPNSDSADISDTPTFAILTAEFASVASGGAPPWGSDAFWGDSTPWGEVIGNTILVTTDQAHGLVVGEQVFLDGLMAPTDAGLPDAPNGLFVVFSVPTPNSFIVSLVT